MCNFIGTLGQQNFQQFEVDEMEKKDIVNLLPQEMSLEIFSHLNSQELSRCFRVNKTWKALAEVETLWETPPKIAFGKKQWETYFGDIGEEPLLPKVIHKILKCPCPFWPGKKVEETHMLVLIPKTVNGNPLNLITLGELVKAPKEGRPSQYLDDLNGSIVNAHGHQATPNSHWVLMTKDVIEGSRNNWSVGQEALIASYANYEVPKVLNVAICSFMNYLHFGELPFTSNRWTYTRCKERAQGSIVVGCTPNGLMVFSSVSDGNYIGMAAERKF
jgi:hypothetical protein